MRTASVVLDDASRHGRPSAPPDHRGSDRPKEHVMRNRTRICLTAAAAALAVYVVTAAPSPALPPPGDDGESPIDRPPPTRPPTATTTTTLTAPRVLESLTVT